MRSEGQDWALGQLEELAEASAGTFELFETGDPAEEGNDIVVVVSVDCRGFKRKEGGVPLKLREKVRLEIPWIFPLSVPRAYFTHKRYAGFAHIQWGDYICLHQAPEVEWLPGRGMFGFMRRLHDWLKAAAAAELDPIGMPLHPPVAYTIGYFCVVPRENAPAPPLPYWSGYVEITSENNFVAEFGRWIERSEEVPDTRLASAILLPTAMPHEYPATMLDLLKVLIERGVPLEMMRLIMTIGVLRTPPGKRAIFVLGAAMRGIAGQQRLQHLACWRIDADRTDKLREAAVNATADNPIDVEEFYAWALDAKVEWCRVLEDRPEIVERRDSTSPANCWRGKHVAILGCGAIGSAVALMLARAGVGQLQLFDNGVVTPGILVRQGFRRDRVGYTKASSLKVSIAGANPDVGVTTEISNILSLFKNEAKLAEMLAADVIIDATASLSVSAAFEAHFRTHPKKHPPIISMALGHNADFGMMTLTTEKSAGMSLDLDRRIKLAFADSTKGRQFLEEFWPTTPDRRKLFQPEPGCSSPTFRGSYPDVLSLAARMSNVASTWLSEPDTASRAFAMDLSGGGIATGPAREVEFIWQPYSVLTDSRHGYEVRLTPEALKSMLAWVRRSERMYGDRTETGGVLFGQVDEFLKVVWIDEVSGPPPDSMASPEGFVCGTSGVMEMHEEKLKRASGSITFVGMWHTHPQALPVPSPTDLRAMRQLLQDKTSFRGRRFLMLIVGGTSKRPILSSGVFERSDYAEA
ncbi:MAG TPA: ThiF family adenylyltransferase [Pseudaminobacter sp.]|nr:ThiF family adenylyltransferase [Pseudaminobacter sp.]